MKICVITPCLAPERNFIRLLDESASRFGIEVIPHGIGRQFSDWANMLISETVPALKEMSRECTHALYVDGRDSIFIASLDEIVRKYALLGSPSCLMSHDDQYPSDICVNAGGYLCEIEFMVDLWTRLAEKYARTDGDYQKWVQQDLPIPGVVCDRGCSIFQCVDGIARIRNSRMFNPVTGSEPCILHFRGGYSDPERGREHRILPILEALYGVAA